MGIFYQLLACILGASFGASVRFSLQLLLQQFPNIFSYLWASIGTTLIVNVLGSFGVGCILSSFGNMNTIVRIFWITGFLGGLTTFSAFSNDAIILLQNNRFSLLFVFVFANVFLSLLACFLAYKL